MKRVLMAVLLSGAAYGAIPTPVAREFGNRAGSACGPRLHARVSRCRMEHRRQGGLRRYQSHRSLQSLAYRCRRKLAGTDDPGRGSDLAPSSDGTLVYAQDSGGNEYYDLYAIPQAGGQQRRFQSSTGRSYAGPRMVRPSLPIVATLLSRNRACGRSMWRRAGLRSRRPRRER